MSVGTDDLSSRVAPIAEALIARSNGRYDEDYVRRLVANVASLFDGAPVQDYVAVLVAKQATDELRKLDALRPRAAENVAEPHRSRDLVCGRTTGAVNAP